MEVGPIKKKNVFVCIHGQESTSHVWAHFKKLFSLTSDVITFDLSGHGVNPQVDESFSFETYVKEVDAVVKEHQLTRFSLVAHSMGGRIASVYASRHPGLIEQLLLFDCKLAPNQFKEGSLDLVNKLKSTPSTFSLEEDLYSTYTSMGYPLRKLQRWKEHGTIYADEAGWHVSISPYIGYLMRQEILSSTLPWDGLRLLRCPVTLYVSTHNSIIPQDSIQLMKSLVQYLTVVCIPNSNHQNIIDRFCHITSDDSQV